MANPIMYVVCLAIIKTVVRDRTTLNVNDRRCPGTCCLHLITTHNIQVALKHDSEPYHRCRISAEQLPFRTALQPLPAIRSCLYTTLPNMTPLTGLIIMIMSYWKPRRPITKTLTMMTLMETGINTTIMNQKPRQAIMQTSQMEYMKKHSVTIYVLVYFSYSVVQSEINKKYLSLFIISFTFALRGKHLLLPPALLVAFQINSQ